MQKTFQAEVEKQDRLTYIRVPFNPSEAFNMKGSAEVKATVNGTSFSKKLLSRGKGKYILTFNKDLLKRIGVSIGETVQVVFEVPEINNEESSNDPFILNMYEEARVKKEKQADLSVLEAVFTRRSIRSFKKEKIEDSKITTILKAGAYAPSAENKRHVDYLVIKEESNLERIAGALPRGKMIQNAGCAIVVCGNTDIQKQKGFLVEDCSASIQNMLLTAHGIGLSAVWCGVYPMSKYVKEIRALLKIPPNILPVGIVAVGYSDDEKIIANKFDERCVHREKW